MAGKQEEQPPEAAGPVKQFLAMLDGAFKAATAPNGPFPMAEEEVSHHGTIQKYRCFQRGGPQSRVSLTLPELYKDCFTRFGSYEYFVYEQDRRTYAEVAAAASGLARELAGSYGIQQGSCVAVAGRNHPDWAVAFFAVTGFLGTTALPVNSWWMGEELRYGLEDSKTQVLIADTFILERAPFLSELKIPAICMMGPADKPLPAQARRLEDVIASGKQQPIIFPEANVEQEATGLLMYTSGTTSKPKGVVLTHRQIMSAINTLKLLSFQTEPVSQTVALIGAPFFHVTASHVGLLGATQQGGKVVTMYKWDPTKALKLVAAEKITTLVGVPTMTYEIVNHPDFHKYDTSSLSSVGGGGAQYSPPMIKTANDKLGGAKTGTGYGLTETNAVSVIMPSVVFPLKPKSCGIPMVTMDVCILGEKNEKLPPGEMGEICFWGTGVMKEYWGKADKTAEVFYIDGEGKLWFRSGDLGILDEDGFVYVMDRAKEIIIRGGENISCGEVESALYEHPAVGEAAAIGLPDENLGEVVGVAIAFKPGVAAVSAEELREHAKARLASFKVPSQIFVWEEVNLPRGATGKIQRREIRDRVVKLAANAAPRSKM